MNLKNVMSTEIHAVSKGATAHEAAQLMDMFQLSFMPVVCEGKAIGTLTADDLVRRVLARGMDPLRTSVADVMDSDPVWLYEDEEVEEAALAMRKSQTRHVLICRLDGTLAGIFTLSDLAMLWEVGDTGEVLRRIAEPRKRLVGQRAHGAAFAS